MGSKQASIGIIGAGPAGITLARMLMEQGFRKVTILERSDRVGGKAYSFFSDGRTYNAGACYTTLGYGPVHGWLKQYGIRRKRVDKTSLIDRNGIRAELIQSIMAEYGLPAALWQVLRYIFLWLLFYYHTQLRKHVPSAYLAELSTPAHEWFERHRLPFLIKTCRRAYQGMGYGLLEQTSVLHVLRWVTPALLISGVLNLVWEVDNFQSLFERMAVGLDIRYNAAVEGVSRREDGGFDVRTQAGRHHFDLLVIACYLDDLPVDLQELSPTIARIVPGLLYKRWVVSLCTIRGARQQCFYEERMITCPDAWENPEGGEITAIRKHLFTEKAQSLNDDQYMCFQLYNDASTYTPQHSAARLAAQIQERGGLLEAILYSFTTRYSPTYTPTAIRGDLPATLQQAQGEHGLYFTGATFSHESVRDIANFNRQLAARISRDLGRKMA